MRNISRSFLLALAFIYASASAAKEPITFELSVSSTFVTYSDILFESPSYAAMAFQNTGTIISQTKPVKFISKNKLQIGAEKLEFDKKKGSLYQYTASIGLPLGGLISLPVDIDVSNLVNGKLKIVVHSLGSALVPQEMILKVESKLQSLANVNAQKSLIDYLSVRSKGGLGSFESKEYLYEQIAFDAINQINASSPVTRANGDIGQAESLSNQLPLIIAIIIWCMGFPICLYLVRRHRQKMAASTKVK